LAVALNEREESHRGMNIMTTNGHKKGFEGSHRKSSHDKLDREITAIKVQLEVMRELLHKGEENHGYGWTLQRRVK